MTTVTIRPTVDASLICQNFAWDNTWELLGIKNENVLKDYFPHTFLLKNKTIEEACNIRDTFLSDEKWTLVGHNDYEIVGYFVDKDDMMRMILQCM